LVFEKDLLKTLRSRELQAAVKRISAASGLIYQESGAGEYASGTYRRRLDLVSGRFAVLDDGAGFRLVPWSPSIESRLGQHITGVVRDNGSVAWSLDRPRGLSL
jgi:hypothetical protein